ncbi:hypothetical protein OVS_03210 [Mycoplasma ovis str. Michigan]|uniref:Ig-like domain-containing protein n=1 Tax=Mycoplasma ovis str. Michigan TaxID=1415773 RepID=A0ABN4BLU1_9MOLU|nr:hypothetical protein OVS_03210 [Mycoplasma ovis str. Michigan]
MVPAIGAVAGASVVIPVVSKSSSGSKYSPTELKVKNVGNCKLVAGKEEGKEREKSQLIVCLSGTKEQPTKPEVTFKWFKNLEDSEPVNVKQITITPQGRLQFLLN